MFDGLLKEGIAGVMKHIFKAKEVKEVIDPSRQAEARQIQLSLVNFLLDRS